MNTFINEKSKSQIDLLKLQKYGIVSDELDLNNLKRDDWLLKTNRKINELNKTIEDYEKVSERVQDTLDDYFNDTDENIFVSKLEVEDTGYLGCFTNMNGMENTGKMNFEQCKQNAVDLGKPFLSLLNEGKDTYCYLGDDLGEIIKDGTTYNEIEVWRSTKIYENMEWFPRKNPGCEYSS